MFLTSLTLKGFKSFADPTVMRLEPGVTVVVGPNGSGKSNVVDAIAWVLGAQAPSSVRSQKMDDVIFAGTAKRPALGRAEVTLTIDNSAGLLPIEFTEVTVSRTLFRTGDSEYAINGVSCRLLDVQELLSDAGVGRQQHVIVSQGQIDAVLNARPEDRRSIIEEAAGVLKHRRRKEKAERRLEATEASLMRAQDLLREVRRQLRPLERQAEAARRHGDLVAELSALRIFLAGREIAGSRQRLGALPAQRVDVERTERELRAELARLDTEVLAAEAELTARGDDGLSDEVVRVEQLRERARGIDAVIVERRRSIERDRGQLMDTGLVANLEHDAARLREELAALATERSDAARSLEQLVADEEVFEAERDERSGEQVEAGAVSAASAAAEVRGELKSVRVGVQRAGDERRRVEQRSTSLRERAVSLDETADRLKAECERAERAEAPLVADGEAAEARRSAAEAAAEVAAAANQAALGERSRWQARAEALQQALQAARAAAGAERLTEVDGVLGTLLDLMEIEAGWEAAVESALGEAIQAVVVSSPEVARRALRALRDANVSGAVLALGASRAAPVHTRLDGVGHAVRPHVDSRDAGVRELLDGVLGAAVRVATWTEAIDLAIARPDLTVVTPDGDRFASRGWRSGASGSGATAAALEEAEARAAQAIEEAARHDGALRAARAELQAARQHEIDVHRQLDAHDVSFTVSSEALARVQGERRGLVAELEALERSAAEATERDEREQARLAELERLITALEADEQAEAAALHAQREATARVEARARALLTRRRDLEVRNAGLHEREQLLERRLAETEQRLEADGAARIVAAERRTRLEADLAAIDRLAALVGGHRMRIEARHDELLEIRRRQSDEVRAAAAQLDTLRRARAAAERRLDETREQARRFEIEDAEARMRLEATIEALRRDHDVEPEAAERAELAPLPEGVSAPARVRDLDRELRLLGPINPLALEEFNALQERHTFLETQLEDVRTTRRDLSRVIKAIDLEIETVFGAAYADVATHFTSLFEMLFPGGAGKLVLTQPDDLLRTGIEVEAKPSGKNVKKLSLLSGGERSLTALAFLFAVFRSRPSPFYVMDEVEAALDDVNLHRFLGLLQEFRREAQLIVVSHQKRTMEAGDCLLGVTMQPGGSSKVVVERVSASA